MKTVVSAVSFRRPFLLPGFDQPQPAGSFEVITDYERLDTSVEAWRRTATSIVLVGAHSTQRWPVEPRDLESALLLDRTPANDP